MEIISRMASPEGTGIEDLSRSLHITRRSVFRLIRIIERDFHIPVIVNRESFGGPASYRLPVFFVDKLSHITITRLPLTFNQALLLLLCFENDTGFQEHSIVDDSNTIRKRIRMFFDF
jgi:hypothetical protein